MKGFTTSVGRQGVYRGLRNVLARVTKSWGTRDALATTQLGFSFGVEKHGLPAASTTAADNALERCRKGGRWEMEALKDYCWKSEEKRVDEG